MTVVPRERERQRERAKETHENKNQPLDESAETFHVDLHIYSIHLHSQYIHVPDAGPCHPTIAGCLTLPRERQATGFGRIRSSLRGYLTHKNTPNPLGPP